jgi:hypothetical protein
MPLSVHETSSRKGEREVEGQSCAFHQKNTQIEHVIPKKEVL